MQQQQQSAALSSSNTNNNTQQQNDYLQRCPDQYIPIPIMASLLSELLNHEEQIDDYKWESYASISIINRPVQLLCLLRTLDVSCLPSFNIPTVNHFNSTVHLQSCQLTTSIKPPAVLLLTPLQMLKILCELTMKLEWRVNIPLFHHIQYHSISLITNPVLCLSLAPWLRLIRILKDDYLKYIKTKVVALSTTSCRMVAGWYTSDSHELIKKTTTGGTASCIELNISDINNTSCFTDERIAHIVIQLSMQRLSNYFNYVNVLQSIKLLLQNPAVYQTILSGCGYPHELTTLEQRIFDNTSVNTFDRLVAGYFLNLKQQQPLSANKQHAVCSFIPNVCYYASYASMQRALLLYGNYALYHYYEYIMNDPDYPVQTDGFLFIPNKTASEVAHEFNVRSCHNRTFWHDVQWKHGQLGTLIEMTQDESLDIMKRNIVMIYSSGSTPQPNFLFAMMSWFTFPRLEFRSNADSFQYDDRIGLQDLDTYARLNPSTIEYLYKFWKMEGPVTKPVNEWNHEWHSIRCWILTMGELIHTFVRCIMRCTDPVPYPANGIFIEEGKEKEVYDTKMVTKLLDWLPFFYKSTQVLYKLHYSVTDRSSSIEYQQAYKHLVHVLVCFYMDSIDVFDVSDPMNYFVDECKQFELNVTKWFGDKRVVLPQDESFISNLIELGVNEYHGGTVKVVDKWYLVREMLSLALGGGTSADEYAIIKKYTQVRVPFIVWSNNNQQPNTISLWGENDTNQACLVTDSQYTYKQHDVSPLLSSIIPSDIQIDKSMKSRLLRLFTDTAKMHTLAIPSSGVNNQQQQQKATTTTMPVSDPTLLHQSASLPVLAPYQELTRQQQKTATTTRKRKTTTATSTNPEFSSDDESVTERKEEVDEVVDDDASVLQSHAQWTRDMRNKYTRSQQGGVPVAGIVRCSV